MIQAISSRFDYTCLETFKYLNQASLGLIGQPSVSAMHKFLDQTARHGNLRMSDTDESSFLNPLRSRFAQLIDSKPENIAIISSASEILSQLPYLLSSTGENKAIFVSTDFPAITRPWLAYSKKNKCKTCFVVEEENSDLTTQIIKELDKKTSVVCVSYVQYSTGTRLDIKRLQAATKSYGAKLVVDITQAAGAIPISVRDWCADIVVCSGYKWLGGHGGIAFAYFNDQLLAKQPISIGWFGGQDPFEMDATRLLLSNTASKYTQSTLSYISVVGLVKAIDMLIGVGIANIECHAKELSTILTEGLKNCEFKPYCKLTGKETANHIIALESSTRNIELILKRLKENNIVCGSRNNRIRISVAHYNNEEDIAHLLYCLK